MADPPWLGALERARSISSTENTVIEARGLAYRELNARLAVLVSQGARHLTVRSVAGQRYIGTNLRAPVSLVIEGVPGNDLGAFMDGPIIEVMGQAQDGCGNTMNGGVLAIHGRAGDIVGHSMRGGAILVEGNAGYRVGIHMKEYGEQRPVVVIGGTAQHFLGEYMAGGIIIVLGRGLEPGERHPSRYIGTGMHGGVIYLRGAVDERFLGKEVGVAGLDNEDMTILRQHVRAYGLCFGHDHESLLSGPFVKLYPRTDRPYGRLYAY